MFLGYLRLFPFYAQTVLWEGDIKLMKGKALRKYSLHEKTAASVLLKLFISSNEWCHTTEPNRQNQYNTNHNIVIKHTVDVDVQCL